MTMDFAMAQCLQSDARQSHSLDADLDSQINNETGKKRILCVKDMQCSILGFFGVNRAYTKPA